MNGADPASEAREPGFLSKTWALARKDLRIEMRSRDTLPPMVAFSVAVTLLLAFSLPGGARLDRPVTVPLGTAPLADVLAGFLWVTVLFAGLIGFARTFETERRDRAIDPLLLLPVDRSALFLAKALANLVYLVVIEAVLVPAFALVFHTAGGSSLPGLMVVLMLVDIGTVAAGTLFAALAAQTRSRELMLPILALPALVPIFIAAVELTSDLFLGGGMGAVTERGWFGILAAYDAVFAIVGILVFEFALD